MRISDYPLLVFFVSLALLAGSLYAGVAIGRRRKRRSPHAEEADFAIVIGGTLTLLGLVVSFAFAMAVARYDQRKMFEEEEANAIGTEYLRVGLLGPAAARSLRARLRDYTDLRIAFYSTRDDASLAALGERTATVENAMWSIVEAAANDNPTPPALAAVIGMNDVINRRGYTQFAWSNRIPRAAWGLMLSMAICGHVLLGEGAKNPQRERFVVIALPLVISIAFFLIADIDSARHGIIRVAPDDLLALAAALKAS
ncbi:hypothetical protein DWG18_01320 [Lysobacter sp. TY2-98]|uniref:bestrophin-like domain n=1 Tax=Lysobacter sp. TY2-98 TaxID=2290922 RepID=UPI000E1FF485|nr:hypothetical protein [Lysobacter sp. TY2-98]AXK71060.1 hypothetical protein DWG18_01320 [Lysobacter sp. TY2-98]